MQPIDWRMLGDTAWIVYFAQETEAFSFARALRQAGFPWLQDVVPAYLSVGVFFDPEQISLPTVRSQLEQLRIEDAGPSAGILHQIPCCYQLGPDLDAVCQYLKLRQPEQLIELHTSTIYTVYAIGFAPGFPYLGYLPPELCGVPRLASPRLRVEPGSVGLTGRQTGIYPLERPGGWHLIGRTPLKMVDLESAYFPIQVGDRVQFQAISVSEFADRMHHR